MQIAWKDEYDLGIASIDTQHRKIIGIINGLARSMEQDDSSEDVARAIEEMRRYAEDHLSYEERLFDECGYAGTDDHRREHDTFRETIEEFCERAKAHNNPIVAIELLGYLEEWLLEHILVSDRRYVETFKSCGVR